MDRDTPKIFAEAVLRFIRDRRKEFYKLGIENESLRLAIPQYLVPLIKEGMWRLKLDDPKSDQKTISGIEVHPTWENAITFYYIGAPCGWDNIPIFKLGMTTEYKEYGLGRKVLVDLANTFSYKL